MYFATVGGVGGEVVARPGRAGKAGRRSPSPGCIPLRLYQQENGNHSSFLHSWEVIERAQWKLAALYDNFALTQKGNRKGPSIFLCEFLSLLPGPFLLVVFLQKYSLNL